MKKLVTCNQNAVTNENVKKFTPNEILCCVLGDVLRTTSVSNISYYKEENKPSHVDIDVDEELASIFGVGNEEDFMSIFGFDGEEASND